MSTVNFNDTTPAAPTNFNNLKWQSDLSGNISAYDPGGTWQTWTPTFNYQSMTGSALTVRFARFNRQGAIGYVQMNFQVTLGGTAASFFNCTGLPVDPVEINLQAVPAGYGAGASTIAPCGGYVQSISSAGTVTFSLATNFVLGTYVFILGGSFRIGA